jgi:hypothetical protein
VRRPPSRFRGTLPDSGPIRQWVEDVAEFLDCDVDPNAITHTIVRLAQDPPHSDSPYGQFLAGVAGEIGARSDSPLDVAREVHKIFVELSACEERSEPTSDAAMAVDTLTVMYLAQGYSRDTGQHRVFGVSPDKIRALAYIGAAEIENPGAYRYELFVIVPDDPAGWVLT